tara:strand:- start:109659 stop:110570 length:912 start_codon:yes stop_codon:yes gene_type:complete
MKKGSIIALLLVPFIIISYFVFNKYKEYTSRIYLLEKNLTSLNKTIIKKELIKNNFQKIDKLFTQPEVRVLSHTYTFNKLTNKKAPKNYFYDTRFFQSFSYNKFPHIFVGDFIWSDTKEDLKVYKEYEENKMIYLMKGNHESMSSLDKKLKGDYDFKIGNFHFICVETKQQKDGKLLFNEETLSFLEKIILDSQNSDDEKVYKKIVLIHHNIFTNELNSNLPYQELEPLKQKIKDLSPSAVIIGDGGAKSHLLSINDEDLNLFLTGFPYVNIDSPPKWIDLYPNYISVMVNIDEELYEKKFIY